MTKEIALYHGKEIALYRYDPGGVIDTIDELETEQKCPNCHRRWHTLALTRRMAAMIDSEYVDPNYFAHEDTSEIICEGSDFIGPRRPPYQQSSDFTLHQSPGFAPYEGILKWPWVIYQDGPTYQEHFAPPSPSPSFLEEVIKFVGGFKEFFDDLTLTVNLWPPGDPEPEPPCKPPPDVEIEFGQQNWLLSTEPVQTSLNTTEVLSKWLSEFIEPDIHIPEKPPPMDYTHLNAEPYFTTYDNYKRGKK